MFSFIEGRVVETGEDFAVLQAGGLGFRVQVSQATLGRLPAIGETARLRVRMVVREDEVSLYGFHSSDEENCFQLLNQVAGVGPRVALAVLSSLAPDALAQAVAAEDADRLRLVPGIGKRLAERIVVELKDRVEASAVRAPTDRMALDALIGLGVREAEARRVLDGLQGPTESVVKEALRRLGEAI